jgi:flavin-dependent dehydrogenase
MPASQYDAIVVGARCAGSPTAMLLARKGHKVLLVDRATFPSDTVSTHLVHPPGMAALRRWGLDSQITGSTCPPIDTYAFDFGPVKLAGSPGTDEQPASYSPRRTILDKLLIDAASLAGVEVREAFTVENVEFEDGRVTGIRGHSRGGETVSEKARIVIGADGRHSIVARQVRAERYNERPEIEASYYSYWSGVPMNGRCEFYDCDGRGFGAWPTCDGLTLIVGGWPYAQFEENKKDIEGNLMQSIRRAPGFYERLQAGKRESRWVGAAVPNFFYKPFGAGWALVGDAGYIKDFITAQGISDAFRDAELCASAVDQWLSGLRDFDDAMSEYQRKRDDYAMPRFQHACEVASFAPPPPEQIQLMTAMMGNQKAMDGFAKVFSGVLSAPEFFSEENIGRILSS